MSKFTLTIECASITEFNHISMLLGNPPYVVIPSEVKPEAEKKPLGKKVSVNLNIESEAKSKDIITDGGTLVKAPIGDTDSTEFAKVKASVLKLAKTKGRDASLEVLGKFDVKRITELKPEQYPEVLDAVQSALDA